MLILSCFFVKVISFAVFYYLLKGKMHLLVFFPGYKRWFWNSMNKCKLLPHEHNQVNMFLTGT